MESITLKEFEKEGVTYKLVTPSLRYEQSFRTYITELKDEERYPFVLDLDASNFNDYLRRLNEFKQGIDIPEGYVESSTFWLVCGDALLGVSNLRHRLNEQIAHVGGHVGLGIRPSARGKGLSTLLLHWTCEIAKAQGIGESPNKTLHVHCYSQNEASKRMIESSGGVLNSIASSGHNDVSRYNIN